MHTLHGRSLAVATGVRLGNHELKVICTGGDGDGFGIGGNHFIHTMRRNVDLTYIVMDNQIYGLTTGQSSPTSVKGMKTKSTPFGNVENPINPIPLAIVGGATYVARGFSGKQKHLVEMFKGAIQHKGFALVDVFSPCVTYNKDNTYQFFNPRVKMLEELGHDPTDFDKAMERGYQWGDEIPIGLFWKRTDLPSLEELEPVLDTGEAAGVSQSSCPFRTGESADSRVALSNGPCSAEPSPRRPGDRELRCNHSSPQYSTFNWLMILAALIEEPLRCPSYLVLRLVRPSVQVRRSAARPDAARLALVSVPGVRSLVPDGDAYAAGAFGTILATIGLAVVRISFARPLILDHSATGTRLHWNRVHQRIAFIDFYRE